MSATTISATTRTRTTASDEPDKRTIRLVRPTIERGHDIHALIRACPPLDINSSYAYLLLAHHFAETCVLALDGEAAVGFVSGYVPPARPDTLFVWQVAVHPAARGLGLGRRMLRALLERDGLVRIERIETTVSPGNAPSRRMFGAWARELGADISESPLFAGPLFGDESHDEERLLVIAPVANDSNSGGKP